MRPLRDGLLTAAGAAGTAVVWHHLRQCRAEPWSARWERTNHAGSSVTLLEGVALVAGTTGTAVLTSAGWGGGALPYAVASLGAGSLGALDDLRQDTDRKGLAGHLSALAHGRVTTGAVKVLGLVATGLVAAAVEGGPPLRSDTGAGSPAAAPPHTVVGHGAGALRAAGSVLVGGAVIAGSANLANLFDLRPGRALKVGTAVAVPLVLSGDGSAPAAVTLGACLALLPQDLAGTSMLGDTGANPLGAVLGVALIQRQSLAARLVTLGVITGLTLASEKVSFTRVIESTPVLRELDALGRPPR